MLKVHSENSNLQDAGPEASLQDSSYDLDDSDLESLSDSSSLGDEDKGKGEELRELMELMDQQLAGTVVGSSFERESRVSAATASQYCY